MNLKLSKIIEFFESEKIQLPCWVPVFISAGILIGLKIKIYFWIISAILLALIVIFSFCNSLIIRIIIISFASILLGCLAINIRINSVDSPVIKENERFSLIIGKIDNITPLEHGHRVLLSELRIKKIDLNETPKKIRLTVRTKLNNAKIGDIIGVSAILSKPMAPYLPNSYDFARDAYFKKIGAVGYSVSNFKLLQEDKRSFFGKVNILRNNIQKRVNTQIGQYHGSIATALMLNEYANIDKNILKDLRDTGLAHILSVSGMHLSLVAAIFFFTSRFLLNCFEYIALRVQVKKIAALISLIGSFGYLLLSGMEVAAIRSFIMTSMIIVSVIVDRTCNPMRAITIAAIIILLFAPENIIHPSFQMSFAAVLALIACYELFSKLKFDFSDFNLLQKFLFYLLSVSFSSLVAGMATAPFALYHFSQSSNYSIIANLLAIPITSFWLMPCVVLTFLLYPLHLEFLPLYLMKYGIDLMLKISHFIAKLPYSVSIFAKISDINLIIITIGMLWFCIWNNRIRYLGFAIILCGIILQSSLNKPKIFVDWEEKKVAILDQENRLIFITKQLPKFKKQLLMNQLGSTYSSSYKNSKSKDIVCENDICNFKNNHYVVEIFLNPLKIRINKYGKLKEEFQKEKGVDLIYLDK